jgi:hypothetical protein
MKVCFVQRTGGPFAKSGILHNAETMFGFGGLVVGSRINVRRRSFDRYGPHLIVNLFFSFDEWLVLSDVVNSLESTHTNIV